MITYKKRRREFQQVESECIDFEEMDNYAPQWLITIIAFSVLGVVAFLLEKFLHAYPMQ